MLTNFVRLALQSNQWQFAIQTVLSSSPRPLRGGGGGSAPATAADPGIIASPFHPSSLSSRPLPVASERGDSSLSPVQYAEMARLVVQWLVHRGQTTTATQRQQEPTSRYSPAGSIALHHNHDEPHHREDWWMGLRLLQHCCARAEEALAGSVNREGYADVGSAGVGGALDRQQDRQDPEEVYVLRLSQCRSHLAVLQGAMQKLPATWEVCLAVLRRSVECLVLSSSSSPSSIDDHQDRRISEPRQQQQQRPKQERQQRERTIHQLLLLLERYAEATRSELRAHRRRRRSNEVAQPLNSNVAGQQKQAGPVHAVDDEEATLLNTLRCIDALRRQTQLFLHPSTSGASRPMPQALSNNRDHNKRSFTSHHHDHYSEKSANVAAHTATTTTAAASSTWGKASMSIIDTMSYNMMLSTSLQQKRNRHVSQQPQPPAQQHQCSSRTSLVLSWEQALRHFCLGRTKKKQQQTRHKEDNVDGGASRPNTISLNTLLPLLAESDQEGLVWETIRFVRRLPHNHSSASNSSPTTSTMIPHPSHTEPCGGWWWWWYENVSIDAATVKAVAECSVRLQSWQMAMAVLQGKLQPIDHSSNSSQSSTTTRLTSSRGGDPVGFMMDTNAGAEKRFVSDSAAQCVTDATPQNDVASTSGSAPSCSVSTAILCVLTLKESAKWEPCLAWWNSLPEQHPYRQHLLLCSYVASCVAECGRMYCARRAKRAKQQQKVLLSAQRLPIHSTELPLSMHHHRRQKGDEVEGPVVLLPSTSTMPQVQWVWQTALAILAGSARHEPAKAMLFAIRALRTARAWDKALGLLVSQLPEAEGGGTRSSFHNNNNDHCEKVQDHLDQSEANTTKATQHWTDDAAICREIVELLQRKDSAVWIPRHARPVVVHLAERLARKK